MEKMKWNLAVTVLGAGLLLVAWPVSAHHAFAAEYDVNKLLKLRGTVTRMDWVNPHAWIHMNVKNQDGSVTSWMIEGGSPNALLRRGLTKNSLPPGTEIVVVCYQSKSGENRANGQGVTLLDGKKLFLGSSGAGEGPR